MLLDFYPANELGAYLLLVTLLSFDFQLISIKAIHWYIPNDNTSRYFAFPSITTKKQAWFRNTTNSSKTFQPPSMRLFWASTLQNLYAMIAMMKTGAKREAISLNTMNMERTKTTLKMMRSYKKSLVFFLRIWYARITLDVMVKVSM
jgi:hypothetical protein